MLVGQREDLEKQLKQEALALEEQKNRYEEMEVCIYKNSTIYIQFAYMGYREIS